MSEKHENEKELSEDELGKAAGGLRTSQADRLGTIRDYPSADQSGGRIRRHDGELGDANRQL